jgi:dTDP-4-amino-4,6-dideoxygalactose transaminase
MKVPFVDLRSVQQNPDLLKVLQEVVNDANYSRGPRKNQFEEKFAAYIGVPHCIATGNCTDSLEIIFRALEIKAGDEVILPANAHFADLEAILLVQATPVFVDCDQYHQPDAQKIEKVLSNKTKAILWVHLYGIIGDPEPVADMAESKGIHFIEDCAQATGAMLHYRKAGSIGDAAAFSFYPTKNLGAIGDAGAIVTKNYELGQICRLLADHGEIKKNQHILAGRNSRMDEIQAAVLLQRLPWLDGWNETRRAMALKYHQALDKFPIFAPQPKAGDVFHLYVIRCGNRKALQDFLNTRSIGTSIHYPEILPETTALKQFFPIKGEFPIAKQFSGEVLSLPLFIGMKEEQQEFVIGSISDFFS